MQTIPQKLPENAHCVPAMCQALVEGDDAEQDRDISWHHCAYSPARGQRGDP